MDRLTSMAVFVRAVDLGSFAAAAAALELSGPMVGKHVRALEDRLGARLLNRTTRRQSLTAFGQAYYDRCRVVLAEAAAAESLAADHLVEPGGKLRVAVPVLFGRRCVLPVMIVCASPSYLERNGCPRQVEDLTSHQAVIYRRSGRAAPCCSRASATRRRRSCRRAG